jgi:hypothetical protein
LCTNMVKLIAAAVTCSSSRCLAPRKAFNPVALRLSCHASLPLVWLPHAAACLLPMLRTAAAAAAAIYCCLPSQHVPHL